MYFVLLLLLLCQLLVVLLLALGDALPAAADLHHTFFQRQVVQLPVGQQLLGELLVTVPRRCGGAGRVRTPRRPPASYDPPLGQRGLRPSDSHGRLLRFSLKLHLLGGVRSGGGCPHLTQLSLRGHREGSHALHPTPEVFLPPAPCHQCLGNRGTAREQRPHSSHLGQAPLLGSVCHNHARVTGIIAPSTDA